VFDVPGLVAESGFYLLETEVFQEPVGEQYVTDARQQSHYRGVGHDVVALPDQDVPILQFYPLAERLQSAA